MVDSLDCELQQYLFDLQGYLVIENVLDTAQLALLNQLIDAQQLPSPKEAIRFGSAATDSAVVAMGMPISRDHSSAADRASLARISASLSIAAITSPAIAPDSPSPNSGMAN